MSDGKSYLKAGEGTPEEIAEYKQAFAMMGSLDWEKNSIPKVVAAESYTTESKLLAAKEALRLAIGHLEHMAKWIESQTAGYSFEALGEDMAAIREAAK